MLDSQDSGIDGLKLRGNAITACFVYDYAKGKESRYNFVNCRKSTFEKAIREEFRKATDGVVERTVSLATASVRARILRGYLANDPTPLMPIG
jgi:hypothetical protein